MVGLEKEAPRVIGRAQIFPSCHLFNCQVGSVKVICPSPRSYYKEFRSCVPPQGAENTAIKANVTCWTNDFQRCARAVPEVLAVPVHPRKLKMGLSQEK
jgi:hypothetical protein